MEGKDIVSNFLNSFSLVATGREVGGEFLKEKIAKVALDWDCAFFLKNIFFGLQFLFLHTNRTQKKTHEITPKFDQKTSISHSPEFPSRICWTLWRAGVRTRLGWPRSGTWAWTQWSSLPWVLQRPWVPGRGGRWRSSQGGSWTEAGSCGGEPSWAGKESKSVWFPEQKKYIILVIAHFVYTVKRRKWHSSFPNPVCVSPPKPIFLDCTLVGSKKM